MTGVVEIFQDYDLKIRKLNKKRYKEYFADFCEANREYFAGRLEQLGSVDDTSSMAMLFGNQFASEAFDLFAVRGRIRKTKKVDISIYVIYYVFPAILETKDKNAGILCDKYRDAWNEVFGQHIDYADYETIKDGFNEKLFGLF